VKSVLREEEEEDKGFIAPHLASARAFIYPFSTQEFEHIFGTLTSSFMVRERWYLWQNT
jgi:hypothetical protein